ncbi:MULTISPECIES: 16S rRNA (uracil(1498)-N(3))-methyltransferase [Sphingomonas]|uniref:16S rRNA (uracil(1498)-N(3))-methyltransferase n=1 Tax=Sphingomonas TaxID=13687 RepID=UPI000DEED8F1|nr:MULTISPECIES: 16S rRNA (uracil(1498)-N(3))-methyltransferase [Sphingomonas]
MAATPAWPPRSLPRLFVRSPLGEGATVELEGSAANYLGNVLRLGEGGEVLLFDGASGEWLARIVATAKKRLTLTVERQTRPLEQVPDLTLAFAPVKRAQTDWLVEKATELGVRHLQPVMTRRTVAERVKHERLEHIAVEAAEQCGRTLLPTIADPLALTALLQTLDRPLYFADETGGAPVTDVIRSGPAAILIGPEGGFTPEERELVRAHPNAVAISLGPRILRAETAALAALTAYMALAGDWR